MTSSSSSARAFLDKQDALNASLEVVKLTPSLSRVPTAAQTSHLVLESIQDTFKDKQPLLASLLSAVWTGGVQCHEDATALHPASVIDAIHAGDKELTADIHSAFVQHDRGRHGPLLHTELEPENEWRLGDFYQAHNWSTLSKDPENPNASMWDSKNKSDFSKHTTLTGMRRDEVNTADVYPCRWSSTLTGKNPHERMSPQFRDACEARFFFRVAVTLSSFGRVLLNSSAVRDAFFLRFKKAYPYLVHQLPVTMPVVEDGSVQPTVYFVQPTLPGGIIPTVAGIGILLVKQSLGTISQPTPASQRVLDDTVVQLAHASCSYFPQAADPPLVYLLHGRSSTYADSCRSFYCALGHLSKNEQAGSYRNTPLTSQEALLAAGATLPFCLKLQSYSEHWADEITAEKQQLDSSLQSSLIAAADAVRMRHLVESQKQLRPLLTSSKEKILDDDGQPLLGTAWDQVVITKNELRQLADPVTNELLFQEDGEPKMGTGWDQANLARTLTMSQPRQLVDHFTGKLLYLENGEPRMGIAWDQIYFLVEITKSQLRQLVDPATRELLFLEDGEPMMGTGWDQAVLATMYVKTELRQLVDPVTKKPLLLDNGEPRMGTSWQQGSLLAQHTMSQIVHLVDPATGAPLYDDNGEPQMGSRYKQGSLKAQVSVKKKRKFESAETPGQLVEGNGTEQWRNSRKKLKPVVVNGQTKMLDATERALLKAGQEARKCDLLITDGITPAVASRSAQSINLTLAGIANGQARKAMQPLYWASDKERPVLYNGRHVMGSRADQSILTKGKGETGHGKVPLWFSRNKAGPYIFWGEEEVRYVADTRTQSSGTSSA